MEQIRDNNVLKKKLPSLSITRSIPCSTGTDLIYSTKRLNGYQKLHRVYMSNFDAVVVIIIQIIFLPSCAFTVHCKT